MNAAEYLFEKALLALKDRDRNKALDFLSTALKVRPDFAEAWMIRGNIEHAEGRILNALLHHDRAVSCGPNKFDAWCNRGIAFADLGLFDSAKECFEKSIALCNAYEPRMNLANMHCHLMQLDKAEAQYREAIKLHQTDYEGHIQLGLTLLGQGRWAEGFKHYEVRLINTPHPPRELQRWPPWRGEDITNKIVLLYPEQGVGDEILFQRFARSVQDRGARVIVEARPPMYRAAKMLDGAGDVIVQHDEPPAPVDYQCALTDVPMVLGVEPDTIPFRAGYLYQKQKPDSWLKLPRDKLNVGLCWNSGRRPLQPEVEASFKTKSIPLEWLKPLAQDGVQLYSLQHQHGDQVMAQKLGLIDYMDGVEDFADTAALIQALDLVISVDTAVAHLAGAMGRPVWNFVRFSGYWPWLKETRQTNWYDSMTLYRQPKLGDWDEPINRVAKDLALLVLDKQRKIAA